MHCCFFSCDDSEKADLPTSAIIHYSVADTKVAFTALSTNADSYSWDFGDGQTSTDPNPIHVYETGGYYKATLTVNGGTGSASDEADLAIALTPYVLLTGGPTAENGKTWKLSATHSEKDISPMLMRVFQLIEGRFRKEYLICYSAWEKYMPMSLHFTLMVPMSMM